MKHRTLFVSGRIRLLLIVGLWIGVFCVAASDAHAFFPFGFFDQFSRLRMITWPWTALNDVNNDGDISGPNEGIEVAVEGGLNGFTDDEIEIVKESFQVWQDVPTSYIGFHITGPMVDPVPLTGVNDFLNSICMEVDADVIKVPLASGILGLTIPTFVVQDEEPWPDTGPVQVMASEGQIVEMDIVINGADHRALPGQEPLADLKGTLVHEIGHFIGLMHTPLNNVAVSAEAATLGQFIESPVVALRDATNTLYLAGATPTMFPILFLTSDGRGNVADGGRDLAPDDIAGVSFLYPRGDQGAFFTIEQQAWTHNSPSVPLSLPLSGGHVVAWCDVDNDPNTPRVPLFSTMTGLYDIQEITGGRFFLYGMYKVFESMTGIEPFQATYALTLNPINGLDVTRQAPPTYAPGAFQSITGGVAPLPPLFQSEVFHEKGNFFDVAKHDVGTPVMFDRERSTVISVDSAKTLPTILPQRKPMFGDRNDVCPLNVLITASMTTNFPTALRGLRDRVLLSTAMGTALVDTYYHVSPALARFLLDHTRALETVQAFARLAEWSYMNPILIVFALGFLATAMAAWRSRRRRRVAMAACVLMALCVAPMPVLARIANLSESDMTRLSDDIVTGTVQSVTCHWVEKAGFKGIFTDISVLIADTMKGGLNKSSSVSIRQVGGRIGNIVTQPTEMPAFREGEEVMLYLQHGDGGYSMVVGGVRGKYQISVDLGTGEKYVTGGSPEARAALSKAGAKSASADAGKKPEDPRIPLEDFHRYVRGLVKEQQDK